MPKRKYAFDRNECFDIICFYAGQGDCTLIRCPDGRIIMIDCGSKASLSAIYKNIIALQVRDDDWVGKKKRIDALILTHSDGDHYNKATEILGASTNKALNPYEKLIIDKIYFSNAVDDSSPLGRYKGLGATVYTNYFSTTEIYEVTINSLNNNYAKKWVRANGFKALNAQQVIKNRELVLLQGETEEEVSWSVSIIAGNVKLLNGIIASVGKNEDGSGIKDGSTDVNAKSLVTKLQIGKDIALFCGDTTFSTEDFLLTYQGGLIANARLIAAPHHGSQEASSPNFVNKVQANSIAISAELQEHKHRHPRQQTLNRWKKFTLLGDTHLLDYWDNDSVAAITASEVWKKNKVPVIGSTNYMILQTLPPVPAIGNVRYGVTASGSLYRENNNQRILPTAFAIKPDDTAAEKQYLNYQLPLSS